MSSRSIAHCRSFASALSRISCLKMSAHCGNCVRYLVGSCRQRSTAFCRMACSSKRAAVLTVRVVGGVFSAVAGAATTWITPFGLPHAVKSWPPTLSREDTSLTAEGAGSDTLLSLCPIRFATVTPSVPSDKLGNKSRLLLSWFARLVDLNVYAYSRGAICARADTAKRKTTGKKQPQIRFLFWIDMLPPRSLRSPAACKASAALLRDD